MGAIEVSEKSSMYPAGDSWQNWLESGENDTVGSEITVICCVFVSIPQEFSSVSDTL